MISVRHRQKFQARSLEQTGAAKQRQGFGYSFGAVGLSSLNVLCVKEQRVVPSVSLSALQQQSNPWSDHRKSKPAMASLDISITLTPYKLARRLDGTKFCSHDRIRFQMQPTYMVWSDHSNTPNEDRTFDIEILWQVYQGSVLTRNRCEVQLPIAQNHA